MRRCAVRAPPPKQREDRKSQQRACGELEKGCPGRCLSKTRRARRSSRTWTLGISSAKAESTEARAKWWYEVHRMATAAANPAVGSVETSFPPSSRERRRTPRICRPSPRRRVSTLEPHRGKDARGPSSAGRRRALELAAAASGPPPEPSPLRALPRRPPDSSPRPRLACSPSCEWSPLENQRRLGGGTPLRKLPIARSESTGSARWLRDYARTWEGDGIVNRAHGRCPPRRPHGDRQRPSARKH